MEVTKKFNFDAAHFLTKYHGKCENLHGHTYTLEITVEGPVMDNGMVIDFNILKHIVKEKVLEKLDHKLINDLIDNPTAENISLWIWDQITPLQELIQQETNNPNLPKILSQYTEEEVDHIESNDLIQLKKIRLWETPDSYVTLKETLI